MVRRHLHHDIAAVLGLVGARRDEPARRRAAGDLPRDRRGPDVHHIKKSLHEFGTDFDVYTYEDSMRTGPVDQAIAKLRARNGAIYEKDGATWLRTTEFR